MKYTHWYTIIIILFFSSQLIAATKSYTPIQGKRLIVLIDEIECESLSDHSIRAETSELNLVIKEQVAPVLVSRNLLLNYVARLSFTNHPDHPENKELKNSPFHHGIWRIFKIRGAAYYLLVPGAYVAAKKAQLELSSKEASPALGLHFHLMDERSAMLPTHGDFYRNLRRYLAADKDSATLALIDLSQIFILKNPQKDASHPWVFYMSGHGGRTKSTVGTSVGTICKLLNFFDSSIRTKLVYLSSCYLGGPIKHALVSKKPYHFTLALGSITDSSVSFNPSMSLQKFFIAIEKLLPSSEPDELAQACCHLAPWEESTSSSDSVLEFPQILVDTKFRALDTHGTVANLEHNTPSPNKFFQAPKEQKGVRSDLDDEDGDLEQDLPIHPENKIAFLLYENNYPEPIDVSPAHCIFKHSREKTPLSFIPSTASLLSPEVFSPTRTKFFDMVGNTLDQFIDTGNTPQENCKTVLAQLAPKKALFPLFVSMLHETRSGGSSSGDCAGTTHHFSSLTLVNEINDFETPFFGLLRFFRDAFMDASYRASRNIFLIDSLTGFNDLALFAILSSSQDPRLNLDPIFLLHANETITLENVTVSTQGCLGRSRKEMDVCIRFIFAGRCWCFDFRGEPQEFNQKNPWRFKSREIVPYLKQYHLQAQVPGKL